MSSTTVENRFTDWETAIELAEIGSQETVKVEAAGTQNGDSETNLDVADTDGSSNVEAEDDDILSQIESELNGL